MLEEDACSSTIAELPVTKALSRSGFKGTLAVTFHAQKRNGGGEGSWITKLLPGNWFVVQRLVNSPRKMARDLSAAL